MRLGSRQVVFFHIRRAFGAAPRRSALRPTSKRWAKANDAERPAHPRVCPRERANPNTKRWTLMRRRAFAKSFFLSEIRQSHIKKATPLITHAAVIFERSTSKGSHAAKSIAKRA